MFFAVFLANFGVKLGNARGNLVDLMRLDERFMSEMMFHEVLNNNKKQQIQEVCEFVSKNFLFNCCVKFT